VGIESIETFMSKNVANNLPPPLAFLPKTAVKFDTFHVKQVGLHNSAVAEGLEHITGKMIQIL